MLNYAPAFTFLAIALIHFAQAKTLFPLNKRTHCKLGYFLTFWVGLYLPLNFTSVQDMPDFFWQMVQILLAMEVYYLTFYFFAICSTTNPWIPSYLFFHS